MVVQKRRDTRAALRLMRRLPRNQHVEPETIRTDGLRSYPAALNILGLFATHRPVCNDNFHVSTASIEMSGVDGFRVRAGSDSRRDSGVARS